MQRLSAGPVRSLESPRYPSRLEVLSDPGLLDALTSSLLSSTDLSRAAAALVLLGLGGCDDSPSRPAAGAGPVVDPSRAALVAPVFEHGDGNAPGRGAMGCVAVAAPVFLSEEEAIQLITEELAARGLRPSDRDTSLSDVIIRGRSVAFGYDWVAQSYGMHITDTTGPLQLDLMDPRRRVGVEYVHANEYDELGGQDGDGWTADLKSVAVGVGDAIRKQGRGVCAGVFYDPVSYAALRFASNPDRIPKDEHGEPRWAPSDSAAIEQSRRLLRMQVRDFIEWLEGQGAI